MDSLDPTQPSRAEAPGTPGPDRPAAAAVAAITGPAARFGRSLAVVIGIDTYGEGIPSLRSAVADAKAIALALQRDHGFEIWSLFDDDARLPALLALLRERLPGALGPADRLLLYFAGHGLALDGDAGPAGYLVPAHARRAERDGFLPMHVVHGELTRLPVRHALVILDCCFAGTFRWSSLRDIEPDAAKLYRERYDRYIESAAWQVLTSASSDQLALDLLANDRGEGGAAHSPFALALLDALAGAADYTRDNLLTADEIAMFTRERVAPAAEAAGHRQVPQLFPLDRHDGGQFVLQVPGSVLELASAPMLDEHACPYRGLRSFHEEDRALFFGRDAAVRRLDEAVRTRRLTVVVGPSGSGKSSLVHAGLVPALRAQRWTVLPTQRPGREPLTVLDAWTRALDGEPREGDPVASWMSAVAERTRAQPARPWLVIVDQLEELVTHRTTEADRTAFLGALASALAAAPSLHLVVTMRSDAEPQFHDTALEPWWTAARFAVPAMTRNELRQIIEKPATAAVLYFEPSRWVERLLDDVALVPAPLPLLSFALAELYRRCWARWQGGARDRALREADYDEMGSVARALTQRATAVHDELVAEDAAYAITIRNVFTRMIAIVGGELARRRVPRDELVYEDPAENRRVTEVLQRFHDARLILLGTETASDREASAYAEPTHDELVRGWTKVSQWLDERDAEAGTRALLVAFGNAVRSWKATRQGDSYLWNDPRIELLNTLGQTRPFVFNADEARFVTRGVHQRRARRARLIGGLIAVITVLAVAAGVALWQRERADHERDETRRQLARAYLEAGRQLLFERRPLRALAYFVAAREEGEAGPALRMLFWAATRTLPRTLLLHGGHVTDGAFSPDGTRVVTASIDKTALVWDSSTGMALSAPLQHEGSVSGAAFSPDGARVVTTSADRTARIWNAATGKPLTPPLEHRDEVRSAAFSPDGTRVVTASKDRTARVWDAATGKPLTPPLEHPLPVTSAAFSPDGTRVVTASDHAAQIWDAATGQPLSPPLRHPHTVERAAFSADGTRIVTLSGFTAQVWDAATGQPAAPPLRHRGAVTSAALSPDGARVVTASDDQTAQIWDAATGKPLTPPLQHQHIVYSAAFSPDGTRVVTASRDRTARVWDAATGDPLSPSLEHQSVVEHAMFSPDGTRLLTTGWDSIARVWDLPTDRPGEPPLEHRDRVNRAAFSPDDTRVVTASSDRTARIWDAATGKSLSPPLEHQDTVIDAAFSPDGARVVTASHDRTARIWDAATGKPLSPPLRHHLAVNGAAFSLDGRRILTWSEDGTARIWDAATGEPVSPELAHRANVLGAAFSPDGTRVVTASFDMTARVWDAATGKPLSPPLEHREAVTSAAFSPDGARVVTASEDHTARVWDAVTGQPRSPLLEHEGEVESAAFSPDGARVVTASDDHAARIWDARTGELVCPALEHEGKVQSAVFSPDSALVATASDDGTARVWDASTGKQLSPFFQHRRAVTSAAFGRDGTRVVTASSDGTARVWSMPRDTGTLEQWRAIAERTPYVVKSGVLVVRPPPAASPFEPPRGLP